VDPELGKHRFEVVVDRIARYEHAHGELAGVESVEQQRDHFPLACGESVDAGDEREHVAGNQRLAAAGYPFQNMIQEVVQSLPFQSRRGAVVITQNIRPPHNYDHAPIAR